MAMRSDPAERGVLLANGAAAAQSQSPHLPRTSITGRGAEKPAFDAAFRMLADKASSST